MNLIAEFRLVDYVPGQKIWFACIPELLPGLTRYGEVTETKRKGVYELEPDPLVDWFQLIENLERISGAVRQE